MSPAFVLILFLMGTNNFPLMINLDGYTNYHQCADARQWFTEHSWIRDGDRTIYHIERAVCVQERQT